MVEPGLARCSTEMNRSKPVSVLTGKASIESVVNAAHRVAQETNRSTMGDVAEFRSVGLGDARFAAEFEALPGAGFEVAACGAAVFVDAAGVNVVGRS